MFTACCGLLLAHERVGCSPSLQKPGIMLPTAVQASAAERAALAFHVFLLSWMAHTHRLFFLAAPLQCALWHGFVAT